MRVWSGWATSAKMTSTIPGGTTPRGWGHPDAGGHPHPHPNVHRTHNYVNPRLEIPPGASRASPKPPKLLEEPQELLMNVLETIKVFSKATETPPKTSTEPTTTSTPTLRYLRGPPELLPNLQSSLRNPKTLSWTFSRPSRSSLRPPGPTIKVQRTHNYINPHPEIPPRVSRPSPKPPNHLEDHQNVLLDLLQTIKVFSKTTRTHH
ncbi:hypothetical protein llap_22957 [Limosa lapponica baueri]|uniref:Uncharacterized protein n=1 Tax=Limosa lapponica baueri TaxID=1758121 RepID=A0A2I0SYY1_LIMLA|nr:hypothetical protein llap_22957 [Limosa lapponica baueri]